VSPVTQSEPFGRLRIDGAYDELVAAIVKAETGDGFFDRTLNRLLGFRTSFDKKGKFGSTEELLGAAEQLSEVSAIWLPRWDFDADASGDYD
jgi:hypothetical protein